MLYSQPLSKPVFIRAYYQIYFGREFMEKKEAKKKSLNRADDSWDQKTTT